MNTIDVDRLVVSAKNGAVVYDSIRETMEFCLIKGLNRAILVHNSTEYIIDIEKIVQDIFIPA